MIEHATDAVLLDRFVSLGEEAAFEALMRRHGPRVLRVSRRILQHEQDVEDVFQATFLVLARKAGVVRWQESMAAWLGDVARRLALRARQERSRRRLREQAMHARVDPRCEGNSGRLSLACPPTADPLAQIEHLDLRRVLDAALDRLPEKYRAPVRLCDLEGKTHQEAAQELGWPAGSMSRRLDRARDLLRRQLTGNSAMLTVVLLAGVVALWLARGPILTNRNVVSSVQRRILALKPPAHGGKELEAELGRFARSSPARDEAAFLVREALRSAEGIQQHDPGARREDWRRFAGDLRFAALDLSNASRSEDGSQLSNAAHRIELACVRCHVVFRQ